MGCWKVQAMIPKFTNTELEARTFEHGRTAWPNHVKIQRESAVCSVSHNGSFYEQESCSRFAQQNSALPYHAPEAQTSKPGTLPLLAHMRTSKKTLWAFGFPTFIIFDPRVKVPNDEPFLVRSLEDNAYQVNEGSLMSTGQ